MLNDKTKLVKEAKNDKASRCCWSAYQKRVNMQFSGLNKIHSQLTAYIQAKLRVRLRFRLGLGLELGLGLTDCMHTLALIGSKLTVYFV